MSTKIVIKKISKTRQNIEKKSQSNEWEPNLRTNSSFDFGSIQSENENKEECSRCLFGKKEFKLFGGQLVMWFDFNAHYFVCI